MQKDSLESLIKEAKELEHKYEWLQAAELFQKTANLALKNENPSKVANINERIGYCYYRASYQAQTNAEFKERLKLSIQAYEKENEILKESNEKNNQARIKQAKAQVAYNQSCLETNFQKKKQLLEEWWNLENQVLEEYESIRDENSIGRVCTDMIEFSLHRIMLSNHSEEAKMEKEAIALAEKAIQSLSKSKNNNALARAYCFASIWHISQSHEAPELRNKRTQLMKRGYEYSEKAIELSTQTGDAWLIGWAYDSAYTAKIWVYNDHKSAIDYSERTQKCGNITKDKRLFSHGMLNTCISMNMLAEFMEDPDKQREMFEKTKNLAQKGIKICQVVNLKQNGAWSYYYFISAMNWLATIETNSKNKQRILENATAVAREGLQFIKGWKRLSGILYSQLSRSLNLLSGTRTDIEEKRALLLEARSYQEKHIRYNEEFVPFLYANQSLALYNLGSVHIELAKIENNKKEKAKILEQTVDVLEKSNKLLSIAIQSSHEAPLINQILGKHNDKLGRALQQSYYLTREENRLSEAIEAHRNAAVSFTKGEMPAHAAESYWCIAQLQSQIGQHQEASKKYESASQAYEMVAKQIPQLKEFYKDYSLYMQAWSQIEQARYNHSIEVYDESRQNYERASKLHESTDPWRYLAPNYSAWARMEEAEDLSRKENTQQAKKAFQKALDYFNQAETSIKHKIEESSSEEEQKMNTSLLEASDLRRRFCQARIQIEDARLLDRSGKYLQSSKSYGEAAQEIEFIFEKIGSRAEQKELKLLATLCRAWEKMASAEEATSSETYLEAAGLFEQAKEYCYTKKASLWALGNSSFCKGLAAGLRYRSSMDLKENALAKRYVKDAASSYFEAGFTSASEYAKATLRLFDAYVFMNQAEGEVDPEKKSKQYQMAENLLQIAAGSFMKAKQPEKTAQVQRILASVREEKALAVSLSQVMRAPSIASSTLSFTAPSPTSEVSVGLEQFQHANVQANLIAGLKEVKVGESFCLTIEFVNAGKEPALLTKVEDFVPPDFTVVKKPEIYRLEDACLNMKGKQIAPLKLVEAKLVLQPSKKGLYQLKPVVHYLDEEGQNRSLQLKAVEIRVEEVILSDRVSTGTRELDSLLLGGIPKEYAVVLTGSPSDEREIIVNNFLEAGTKERQTSFYITTEAVGIENLLEKSGFYLFLCNPKPKAEVPDLPNVHKLLGKTDLTNLNIALLKAYRSLEQSSNKRVCLEIVSDVLLRYGAEATRRWISELITDMVSKGFAILAVLNPAMHPADHAAAVVDLFDGEISLYQTEDPLECKKSLRVKKLRNQDYLKNSICLT